MSNSYNQTSEYNFPPQNAQQQAPQQAWGSAPQQPKKKGGWWKVLLAVLLVFVLLIALAEFGMRAYMKNQIVSGLEENAASQNVEMAGDPQVSFGASPVLAALFTKTLGELDMTIPSSLDISYEDNDESRPVVKGNPEIHFLGKDTEIQEQGKQMIVGDLTATTSIPAEFMLAQVKKSMNEKQAQDSGNFLQNLITITDIKPSPDNQTLDVEITQGLATMSMKPTIENGQLKLDVDGAKIAGMDMPESIVNTLRDSLADQSMAGELSGLEFESVEVTDSGMNVKLKGQNVDMSQMAQSIEDSPGDSSSNGNGTGSGSSSESGNGSGSSDSLQESGEAPAGGPVGSSGDGYAA